MYRKYPKKEGRTFKYKGYTERLFKRLYISERYIRRNNKKSIARALVRQLIFVEDEETLEKLETKIFESESAKQVFGYLE